MVRIATVKDAEQLGDNFTWNPILYDKKLYCLCCYELSWR